MKEVAEALIERHLGAGGGGAMISFKRYGRGVETWETRAARCYKWDAYQ
jgi:hypothetical protein